MPSIESEQDWRVGLAERNLVFSENLVQFWVAIIVVKINKQQDYREELDKLIDCTAGLQASREKVVSLQGQ